MNLPDEHELHDRWVQPAADRQIDDTKRAETVVRPAEELLHELQVHQLELEMQNEALRQAQIALAESRDRFIDLYDFAPVGYLTLTADGLIAELNLTAATLLGRERNKLLQRRFTSLVIAEDQDRWIQHMLGMKQGDRQRKLELSLQRADGTVLQAQLDCVSAAGSTAEVRIALSDITQRKLAEAELRTLSRAVQQSPASIVITDRAGNIEYVNPRFEEVTGYSMAEALGKNPRILKSGITPAQTYEDMWKAISVGGEWSGELSNRRKNGELFWEFAAISGLVNEYGQIDHYIAVKEDITERKAAEAARDLVEAQLRESQKMNALGTLAGGVAHDFNNVLAAILGNVELARQDVGPVHPALESLQEIRKASERGKHLVDQILAFGRRNLLERKLIFLAPVVEESARLLRATLSARLSLKVACAPDAPAVLADAMQIEQLIINLCHNGWQSAKDQGRLAMVEIKLEAFEQGAGDECEAQVLTGRDKLRPGRYACLSVRDNGSGMDVATQGHLFEPFFTTKPVGEGTGLGLAVVYGIARAHEAGLQVHSKQGEGSEFRVYFPAAASPEAVLPEQNRLPGTAPAANAPVLPGEGVHVLYLDDEESIVLLMKRLLRRRGYRVSGYTDQNQALAAARADPGQFDLAVTDYNMPGMSGLDVARALREIRADLPIVMASGYITEELRNEAPAAGVSELVFKHNTVDELCEAVDRHAQSSRRKRKAG